MRVRRKLTSIHHYWRRCMISTLLIHIIFISCSLTTLHSSLVAAQYEESYDTSSDTNDWREWNYYQILGLLPEDYYYPQKDNNNRKNDGNDDKKQPFDKSQFHLPPRRKRQSERNKIQTRDIKKAYRKQAQKWHPDKIASRKKKLDAAKAKERQNVSNKMDYVNTVDTNTDDGTILSMEECTERFAKIAEAYELLIEEEKRVGYDAYLLDLEDQMQQDFKRKQQQQQQHHSQMNQGYDTQQKRKSFFENFKTDPMAVFEDFFFGTSNSDNEYYGNDGGGDEADPFRNTDDFFDLFFDANHFNDVSSSNGANYQNRRPDVTSEATQVRYDPRFGQDVHRVLHREEFHEPNRQRLYFRVIGQEFIEEFDRMYGHKIGFMPITEPYLVEEGFEPLQTYTENDYGYEQNHQQHEANDFERQQQQQQQEHANNNYYQSNPKRPRRPLEDTSSVMNQSDFISPETKFLRSKNKQYFAGLTQECELVIIEDGGSFSDDVLIWTSGTYVPMQHQSEGCFLALYGSQLALMVGDTEDPHAMLWNSPDPHPLVPGSNSAEETVEYYASLDDDGSLAVYRRRHIPSAPRRKSTTSANSSSRDNRSSSSRIGILLSVTEWWTNLLRGELDNDDEIPHTRAAAAWKSFRKWFTGKSSNSSYHQDNNNSSNNNHFHYRDECVFASGPAGCLTPGRAVIKISNNVKRTLGKTIAKMDHALEDFVESLAEGSEDDLDVLDTLVRVAGKTGSAIGRGGMRMATKGMHEAKMVIKKVKITVQESFGKFVSRLAIDD